MYLKIITVVTVILVFGAGINGFITFRFIRRLQQQNMPTTAIPKSQVVIHIVFGVLSFASCLVLLIYVFMKG